MKDERSYGEQPIEAQKNREIISTPEQEHLIEIQYEDVIKNHAPVDSGKEGIIYRVEAQEIPADVKTVFAQAGKSVEDDSALKVLKVYSSGRAKREYGFQLQAYSIVEEHLKLHPEDACRYARVPAPIDYRKINIDEQTREQVVAAGSTIMGHEIEVLLMDFIEGRDLATEFYTWILDHAPEDKQFIVQNTNLRDFHQLQQAVVNILEFIKVKATAVSEAEREAEQHRADNLNAKKVYDFLRRTGYKLEAEIITQITNTRKLLQTAGLFHNDEHERNFMLEGNQVYLIDFAKATHGRTDGNQFRIEEELKTLTTEFQLKARAEKETDLTSSMEKIKRLAATGDLKTRFHTAFEAAKKGGMELQRHLISRSLSATNSEAELDNFLALLINFKNEGYITSEQAQEIMKIMSDSLQSPVLKRGKLAGMRLLNPAAQRKIESSKELFAA